MKTTPGLCLLAFAALATGLTAASSPLLIDQSVEARFPHSLSLSTITEGQARVVVDIDAEGRLVDWLVTAYTHKAFADEAVHVLRQWRYTVPRISGQPVGIRTELRFDFESKGRVVSLSAIETPDVLLKHMGIEPAWTTRVCALRELDQPLTPLNPASPLYPAQAAPSPRPQSVVLDFYVDEQGQPRMPVVVNGADPHYTLAAMDALTRWRFPAPTRAGRPIAVRARQEFIFPSRS